MHSVDAFFYILNKLLITLTTKNDAIGRSKVSRIGEDRRERIIDANNHIRTRIKINF